MKSFYRIITTISIIIFGFITITSCTKNEAIKKQIIGMWYTHDGNFDPFTAVISFKNNGIFTYEYKEEHYDVNDWSEEDINSFLKDGYSDTYRVSDGKIILEGRGVFLVNPYTFHETNYNELLMDDKSIIVKGGSMSFSKIQ